MPEHKHENDTVDTRLAEVRRLFRDLENDKNLPTFGEHFMHCLMFGTVENVNLKKMYPKTYRKLSKFLAKHNRAIEESQHK